MIHTVVRAEAADGAQEDLYRAKALQYIPALRSCDALRDESFRRIAPRR